MRGKEIIVFVDTVYQRDHPRLCGEKFLEIVLLYEFSRITPAYAGKSGIITVEVSYMQDHPRLCGEKVFPLS